MHDIPTASGIYKITCTVTKKIYIGSAINLHRRKREHFNDLQQNKHHNRYLQNAWNKYGEQAFVFEVLEFVLEINRAAREQYWLDKLKPFGRKGFNIAHNAELPPSWLGKKHTPEEIEKIRQAHLGKTHTPERIEKNRQAHLGQKQSPEQREKQRQFMLGNMQCLGYRQSPEHVEKARQAKLGKAKTPEHREKIRQAKLGKKMSPEAVENMRIARWGKRDEVARGGQVA